MFHRNLKYIIHARVKSVRVLANELNINYRWLNRLKAGSMKRIVPAHFDHIFAVAKRLDVSPVDLFFMDAHEFRQIYYDPEMKTYIEVQDNFLFNLKLILNNVEDRKKTIRTIIRKEYRSNPRVYQWKDYTKVTRIIRGATSYTVDDVIKFSRVLDYPPEFLLFGVQ